MAAKFTWLTHKIVIQLHLVAESCTISVLAAGGLSGNFWIHPRICLVTGCTPQNIFLSVTRDNFRDTSGNATAHIFPRMQR
jgi:hypothetical protein